MTGHVRQRASGKWCAVVSLGRDAKGRYPQHWGKGFWKKSDARDDLTRLLAEFTSGLPVKTPAKLTVGEYLDDWCERVDVRPRTRESYRHVCDRYLKPAIGSLRLRDLRPVQVEAVYKAMRDTGLAPLTVHGAHRVLSSALGAALLSGIVSRNIMQGVKAPKRAKRGRVQPATFAQLATLMEASRTAGYFPVLYTLAWSGMRRSEVLGLRWRDLNLDAGYAEVHQTLHVLKGGKVVFEAPKTEKSERIVQLPMTCVNVLRAHRDLAEANWERFRLGAKPHGAALVFAQPDGKPTLPNTLTHAWVKIRRNAGAKLRTSDDAAARKVADGLEILRLHDLRHTYTSLLIAMKRFSPKQIQEHLGHSAIAVTMDTYGHLFENATRELAEGFDQGAAAAIKLQ